MSSNLRPSRSIIVLSIAIFSLVCGLVLTAVYSPLFLDSVTKLVDRPADNGESYSEPALRVSDVDKGVPDTQNVELTAKQTITGRRSAAEPRLTQPRPKTSLIDSLNPHQSTPGQTLLAFVGDRELGRNGLRNTVAKSSPTIATEKNKYYPGDTTVIYGENWVPGENVAIAIGRKDDDERTMLNVTVDKAGLFTISSVMPKIGSEEEESPESKKEEAEHRDGEMYIASATGSVSGSNVQTEFYGDEPEKDVEELFQHEAYWFNRVTYPTGNFDPAWIQRAAEQDSRMQRAVPDGEKADPTSRKMSPLALNPNAFTALGPAPEKMTGCTGCFDYTTTSGRVNDIKIDPTTTTNGSIVAYAASVGGGVWKTTNCCSANTSWNVVTDSPLVSTTSINTLAIDPNNHNTIYAGTGDLNYGSFSMGSQGILKSLDAGATWKVLAANIFGAAYPVPLGQFTQYQAVGKVRVDPNNSNNVVAGTKTGLYMSYDGGTNWTGPCLTNSFSTMRQDITGLELNNIGGVTRIIAAVGVRGFATTVQFNLDQNGANGLYKGTIPASGCPTDFVSIASNGNGFVNGAAVTNIGGGTPYSTTTPGVGNQIGRIDIAVAPSDPNYIYAQVAAIKTTGQGSGCGSAAGCQLGVWASTNAGATWSFMTGSNGAALAECAGTGAGSSAAGVGDYPQNWYDQAVAVDPNNPDRIYVSTFDVWFATRTGTNFYDTTCGYSNVSPKPVHVDQHALAFVPGSSSILLLGNDGGVHGTTNANAAVPATTRPTWFNMDTGFSTIEFYSGDISGNFATSPNPSANGGAQDNGPSSVLFSGSPTGPTPWQMGLGGDGFYARIDPVGTGATQAAGLITMTGTGIPLANETFVIGSQTFTWKATRAVAGEVAIGTSTGTSRNNIVTAVTADMAGIVTAANSGGSAALITAVTPGAAGNAIVFTEASTNMSVNGTGTLGATTDGAGSPRYWQGNNSGGVSRCVSNCTNPGATWSNRQGGWASDQQSFILPYEIFHGDTTNPANDCGAAGAATGCGHLVAGTVRVWETITGATGTNTWYVNSPDNLTKGTLGNRSFINQLAFEPKDQGTVIVGTNDGAVQIGRGLGSGSGPTRAAGAITLVTGGALAGETFVIGSQTFTWQVAARTGTGQVQINSSTTTAGNNIVAAITADLPGLVTAARNGAVVTVTAVAIGAAGNSIAFTEASTNMTVNGTGTLGGTAVGSSGNAVWVDVTGGNTVLPNRPVLDVAFDPTTTNAPIGYAALGGFNENTPAQRGHVLRVVCDVNCASFVWTDKSGNLPNIPVDSIVANPNYPQQVFAGTDFGLYFTNDITAVSPVWFRFTNGLPAVMIWDMQIDRGNTTLSLWTRGRGAFVWPLPSAPIAAPSTIQFTAATFIGDETKMAAVTVGRTGDTTGPATVAFSTTGGGTATPGSCGTLNVDFVPVPSQLVLFNSNETSKTVNVQLCGDTLLESLESINIALSNPDPSSVLGFQSLAVLNINDTASQFTNQADINVFVGGISNPYPSPINVVGGPPIVGSMRVTLYGVRLDQPPNLDVLLVGPSGRQYILTADTGGPLPMTTPATVTFVDSATQVLPCGAELVTGQFRPTNCTPNQAPFLSPAPAPNPGPFYNEPGTSTGIRTPNQTLNGVFGGGPGNGTWNLFVKDDSGSLFVVTGNIAGWGIQFFNPTAVNNASLAGRITTAEGQGIRNARVTISGDSLPEPRVVQTGSFGYFSFEGLQAGGTYVVTVNAKRYAFSVPSRVVTLSDSLTDYDFVADP